MTKAEAAVRLAAAPDNIKLLATALRDVLVKVGVLRSGVEPSGPELLLAAETYCCVQSDAREYAKLCCSPSESKGNHPDKLLEMLARLEHIQWMAWATTLMETEELSPERRARWLEQMIPYELLTAAEQETGRVYARTVLAVLPQGERLPAGVTLRTLVNAIRHLHQKTCSISMRHRWVSERGEHEAAWAIYDRLTAAIRASSAPTG